MTMFKLSDEFQALSELARDFANKEVWPKARELDETARFPTDLLTKAHSL
ncbi:acyl-CoA dehydrogenase, partial [bacterium]|nr:acyl-CoA dehydrogenase [bacterium]